MLTSRFSLQHAAGKANTPVGISARRVFATIVALAAAGCLAAAVMDDGAQDHGDDIPPDQPRSLESRISHGEEQLRLHYTAGARYPAARPMVPEPLFLRSIDRLITVLDVDDRTVAQWMELYAEYQIEMIEVLQERMPPIREEAHRLSTQRDAMELEEYARRSEQWTRSCIRLSRAIEEMDLMLLWEMVQLLPKDARDTAHHLAMSMRLRELYPLPSPRDTILPGAGVDLLTGLAEVDATWSIDDPTGQLVIEYLSQFAPAAKRLSERFAEVGIESVKLRTREQAGEVNDPFSDRRRIYAPMVQTQRQIIRLNREYAELLAAQLDDDHARLFHDWIRRQSFPDLYPSDADVAMRNSFQEWLSRDELDDGMKALILSYQLEYEEWYEQHSTRMERHVSQWMEQKASTWMAHVDDIAEYEHTLEAMMREHLRKVQSTMRAIIEVIEPERLTQPQR